MGVEVNEPMTVMILGRGRTPDLEVDLGPCVRAWAQMRLTRSDADTISAIARLARVSRPLVSRFFSGRSSIDTARAIVDVLGLRWEDVAHVAGPAEAIA